MGVLDILINDNKEPNKDLDYIYLLDEAFLPYDKRRLFVDSMVKIKYGSIVSDVKRMSNGSFEFKYEGVVYTTNYGWALAENTEDNVKNIKLYLEANAELESIKKKVNKLRANVVDLNGKSRI